MQVETYPENYQQDKKYICPKKISNKLDQSINNIIAKTGFIKYNVEKKCISTNGGNYLGLLYEIDIKGKTKEGDKELNIFVKSVIPGENNLEFISISNIYNNEVFTYKVLTKIFDELQEEAQVPLEERYKMVKSYDETNSQMIVMENVAKKGFTTAHRMDVVSLKFAELAIRELAKFHGFSFILKEKRPDFYEEYICHRKSPYNAGENSYEFIESVLKVSMDYIDDDVRDRVAKFSVGVPERYMRNFFDETTQRCLCHGDYRPNNILMKVIDGEISELIPVDYQLIQFGCPVLDFIYFIVSSTDREFRRAHLSHLRDLYHETLTSFLKYFDLDVNQYYSRKEFDEDYESRLDYGLMLSLIILPFMFTSEDDIPDVTKVDLRGISFKLDEKFKERIRGIIDDYIEWGFL